LETILNFFENLRKEFGIPSDLLEGTPTEEPPADSSKEEIEKAFRAFAKSLSKEESQKVAKVFADWLRQQFKVEQLQKLIEESKTEELEKLPPTKFEEVKRLRLVPIDRDFYDLVPILIPARLTDMNLIHKQLLEDGSLTLKYKIERRRKSIIYTFLIPSEALGRIKDKDIPTVGVNMRRALFAALAFAHVQDSPSPNFKRTELLDFMGEDPRKRSKLHSDLENGLLTLAYGTYTITAGDKVLEVGNIVHRLKLPEKRGDRIVVTFNVDEVKPLLPSQSGIEKLRYISYPTDLLRVKPRDMSLYIRNFCESLLSKHGIGRGVYPKFVRNMLLEDFGIPPKKLTRLTSTNIHNILVQGMEQAKARGLLKDYEITKESQRRAPLDPRKWKVKLIVPSRLDQPLREQIMV